MNHLSVEHYPPTGWARLKISSDGIEKRFDFWLNKPERERERIIRNVQKRFVKLKIGWPAECWVIHQLDQMAAVQREFDREIEDERETG